MYSTSKQLQTLQTCRCCKGSSLSIKALQCNIWLIRTVRCFRRLTLSRRGMWSVGFMKLPQSPDACNGTTLPDAYASGYGASIPDAGQHGRFTSAFATLAQKICCAGWLWIVWNVFVRLTLFEVSFNIFRPARNRLPLTSRSSWQTVDFSWLLKQTPMTRDV